MPQKVVLSADKNATTSCLPEMICLVGRGLGLKAVGDPALRLSMSAQSLGRYPVEPIFLGLLGRLHMLRIKHSLVIESPYCATLGAVLSLAFRITRWSDSASPEV